MEMDYYQDYLEGCLTFQNPTHYDNGNYTLVASNSLGSVTKTVYGYFLEPPFIEDDGKLFNILFTLVACRDDFDDIYWDYSKLYFIYIYMCVCVYVCLVIYTKTIWYYILYMKFEVGTIILMLLKEASYANQGCIYL